MRRYYFDETDGTVDEIDTDELRAREEARGEALAEEYEAFKEHELAREYERRHE